MFAQIVFGVGALAASPAMARRSGDLAGEGQTVLAAASSCPSLPASCQNTTQETNLCCFEGLVRLLPMHHRRDFADDICVGSDSAGPVLGY